MSTTTDGTQAAGPDVRLTDGFRLLIDALKFNGVQTIYGVVGIPGHGPGAARAGVRDPVCRIPAGGQRGERGGGRRVLDQAAGHLPDGVGDRRHLRREGENISLIALRASMTSTSAVVVRVAADAGADAGAPAS